MHPLAEAPSRQAIIVDPVRESMNNLHFPMPGRIGKAVAANLRGGKTDE